MSLVRLVDRPRTSWLARWNSTKSERGGVFTSGGLGLGGSGRASVSKVGLTLHDLLALVRVLFLLFSISRLSIFISLSPIFAARIPYYSPSLLRFSFHVHPYPISFHSSNASSVSGALS